jgi:serine/threonine protein kinase
LQETEAFMIMDLCDGTLDSILQAASGTLPDRAILKIFGDVCSGVLHMHSQQPPIAHRWLPCDTLVVSERCVGCAWCMQQISVMSGICQPCNCGCCCRDLKAENVMVHSSGSWLLCDFGSATNATLHRPTADVIALAEVRPVLACAKAQLHGYMYHAI